MKKKPVYYIYLQKRNAEEFDIGGFDNLGITNVVLMNIELIIDMVKDDKYTFELKGSHEIRDATLEDN